MGLQYASEPAEVAERRALLEELKGFLDKLQALPEARRDGVTHKALFRAAFDAGAYFPDLPLEDRVLFLELSIAAAETLGEPGEEPQARAYEKMASLFGESGDARRQVEILDHALDSLPNALLSESFLRRSKAEALLVLGDYAAAWTSLEACLSAVQRESSKGRQTYFQLERMRHAGSCGQLWLELGVLDTAAYWVSEEARLVEEGGRPSRSWMASRHRQVNLRLAQGDYEGALEMSEQALSVEPFLSQPRPAAALGLLQAIACARLEQFDPEREPRADRLLAKLLEEAALPTRTERLTAMLWKSEVALRAADLGRAERELVRFENALGAPPEGQPVSPVGVRGATLRASLALARPTSREQLAAALSGLVDAYDSMLASWAQAPLRQGGIGFLDDYKRRHVLSELIRLRIALDPQNGPETALQDLLRSQSLATTLRMVGQNAVDLEQVRRLLGDGREALILMPGVDRGHRFQVDQNQVRHSELLPDSAWFDRGRDYLSILQDVPPEKGTVESQSLVAAREGALAAYLSGQLLPDSWVGKSRPQEVYLLGIGWLNYFPLECLLLRDGSRLGSKMAVAHLPSLALGVRLQERPWPLGSKSPGLDFALLAAPQADPRWTGPNNLPDLPWSNQLTHALTAAHEPERAAVFTRDEAHRGSLLGLELDSVRCLQFLVHGMRESDAERPFSLLLAPLQGSSSRLTTPDVDQLGGPRLVLLTSCSSASAPRRTGDAGKATMAAAWLDRGSRAVVQASAEVDFAFALEVSAELQRLLKKGLSPAECLRRIRADHLQGDGPYSAPHYCSLLQVVGLGFEAIY